VLVKPCEPSELVDALRQSLASATG
jgi:hypothetical protein